MECITCDYPLVANRCTNPCCEQYSIKEYVNQLKDKLRHKNMQIKELKKGNANLTNEEKEGILELIGYVIGKRASMRILSYTSLINLKNKLYI